ncbi:MAG: hypothetical protein AAFV88_15175 [Planctomycetota bacterium]
MDVLRPRMLAVLTIVVQTICASAQSLPINWGEAPPEAPLSQLAKPEWFDVDGPERFEPILGVEFGGIWLQRSEDNTFPLVLDDSFTTLLSDSSILEPESASGFRFALQLFNLSKHVPGLDTELIYFEVGDTVADKSLNAANYPTASVLNTVFFQGVPASPVAANTFRVESDIESIEWNLNYRPMARLKLISGLRLVNLEEDFDITDTGTLNGVFSNADNEFFGFQFGGEATVWTNGVFRVFASGKYAFFDNDIDGTAVAQNATIDFSGDEDASLFDLEIGVSGAISSVATLQVAYQGLFLNDAASAVNQSNELTLFGSDNQAPALSDLEWHGLHFGITFVW